MTARRAADQTGLCHSHGDTAGAMSVSAPSTFTAAFDGMRFPVHRAHSAYCHRCPVGLTRATCNIECAESLENILAERGDQIAAVIVEPLLQGAGGSMDLRTIALP